MKESDFYGGDPLARLLINGLNLTPLKFALLVLLLSFFYSLILSFAASGPSYFFNNITSLIWVFVIAPVMAWFYLWGSREMPFLLTDLRDSGAITLNENDVDDITNIYKKPWRMIFSSFIALPLGIVFFFFLYTKESSGGNPVFIIPIIGHSLAFLLGTYMAMMLILALITNIWALHQVFKEREINIAHPLQYSGLNALSDYSLKTVYLAAMFAFMIALFIYRYGNFNLCDISALNIQLFKAESLQGLCQIRLYYLMVYIGFPLYVAVAFSCFFLPLYTAHQRMNEAKDKLLNGIAIRYQENYDRAKAEVDDAKVLAEEIGRIKGIQEFYDLTDQFPEWPFDFPALRNFFLSMAATTLAVLLPILTDYLKSYIPSIPSYFSLQMRLQPIFHRFPGHFSLQKNHPFSSSGIGNGPQQIGNPV